METQPVAESSVETHLDLTFSIHQITLLLSNSYTPLDPDGRQIRLIKLLADNGREFIECELLDSAPLNNLSGNVSLGVIWRQNIVAFVN